MIWHRRRCYNKDEENDNLSQQSKQILLSSYSSPLTKLPTTSLSQGSGPVSRPHSRVRSKNMTSMDTIPSNKASSLPLSTTTTAPSVTSSILFHVSPSTSSLPFSKKNDIDPTPREQVSKHLQHPRYLSYIVLGIILAITTISYLISSSSLRSFEAVSKRKMNATFNIHEVHNDNDHQEAHRASVSLVFWHGWVSALFTGAGAIPLLFAPKMKLWWVGISNAIAAGMMLCASFSLVVEALRLPTATYESIPLLVIGFLFGALAFKVSASVKSAEDLKFSGLEGFHARKALLVIGVMTAHSFGEGVSIGVSFSDLAPASLGLFISSSLALHNIPEGLAVSIVLVPRGVSILDAAIWSIFTSLPQPLMAVLGFLFVQKFTFFLPIGLGFAAGAMSFLAVTEMCPEAVKEAGKKSASIAFLISFTLFIIFQNFIH